MTLDLFDDRYGEGAHAALLELLRRPCVSFAAIATRYGVTRECVRRWHLRLLPEAPTGHARQQLCRQQREKRRLLGDALFNGFYRHVRTYLPEQRLTLIPARDGYRKRTVRLDGHVVALKRARLTAAGRAHEEPAYFLASGNPRAAFIYFELSDSDFLLVPRTQLPARATTFLDITASKYRKFKNTFESLLADSEARLDIASAQPVQV